MVYTRRGIKPGADMDQSAGIFVWLGLAWLAVIWANLYLWHTRRVLKRLGKNHALPARTLTSAAVAKPANLAAAP